MHYEILCSNANQIWILVNINYLHPHLNCKYIWYFLFCCLYEVEIMLWCAWCSICPRFPIVQWGEWWMVRLLSLGTGEGHRVNTVNGLEHNLWNLDTAKLPVLWSVACKTDCVPYINGLVEDCSNAIVLAMRLLQSCTKLSICKYRTGTWRLINNCPWKICL